MGFSLAYTPSMRLPHIQNLSDDKAVHISVIRYAGTDDTAENIAVRCIIMSSCIVENWLEVVYGDFFQRVTAAIPIQLQTG